MRGVDTRRPEGREARGRRRRQTRRRKATDQKREPEGAGEGREGPWRRRAETAGLTDERPGGGGRTDQGRERRTGVAGKRWTDGQTGGKDRPTDPERQETRYGTSATSARRSQWGRLPVGGGTVLGRQGRRDPALRLPPSSPGCVQGARPQSQVSLSSHGRGGAASPSLLGGERVLQPLLPLLAVSGHPVAGRPEVWESHPE